MKSVPATKLPSAQRIRYEELDDTDEELDDTECDTAGSQAVNRRRRALYHICIVILAAASAVALVSSLSVEVGDLLACVIIRESMLQKAYPTFGGVPTFVQQLLKFRGIWVVL